MGDITSIDIGENQETHASAAEINLGEIKRPFTVDDIKDFQRQFKEFSRANQIQGGRFRIGENQFYEYLSSGSFWGAERAGGSTSEALTDEGKQAYNDLLLSTYVGWRANLIKNQEKIAVVRPEVVRQLGDFSKSPIPQSADEVRGLYDAYPILNKLSAAEYQEGYVKGVINSDFLHFKGHRYSGYEYEKPTTEMRIYLNPPINKVPLLAAEFVRIANERKIPYYFKLVDFSVQTPLPESLKRSDRMLFYSDRENAAKIVQIVAEIKDQHPDWFVDRPLPPMAAKVMDGMAVAQDPSDYQDKKFSSRGHDTVSFNEVRAKFLDRLLPSMMKNIILAYPDVKPRGGRTLKDIFNDFVPPKDKKFLDGLWKVNLQPFPNDSDGNRVVYDALRRTMVDVMPNFTPDTLLPWAQKGIEALSDEFGIDPNNLAFNKSS